VNLKHFIKSFLSDRLSEQIHIIKDDIAQKIYSYIFLFKRKFKKHFVSNKYTNSITIGMLAIRRVDYVDLAIKSINSLHYYNRKNKVYLYLDDITFAYFQKRKKKLDFSEQVITKLINDNKNDPWQFTKLRVVLELSEKNIPFVDADSIWHDDISNYFFFENTTFLVRINRFSENSNENNLITTILNKPEWKDFYHFNVGFVFISPKILSDDFKVFCTSFINKLLSLKNDSIISNTLFRVCEEITLSIAAQLFDKNIQTLKEYDGPNDTYLLESIYYGCKNGI
jgi:hypothetical protein